MPWNQYGTKDTYVSSQTSAAAGNRDGALSWLAQRQLPGQLSAAADLHDLWHRFGVGPRERPEPFRRSTSRACVANVVGTGALAHSQQTSANVRLAYDVTPLVQATYSLGIWNNVQTSNPQTYLTSTATGAPTFARHLRVREQQVHLGSDPSQQRRLAQERHQGRLRFRSFGVELQLSAGHPVQPVHGDAVGVGLLAERQDHPQ